MAVEVKGQPSWLLKKETQARDGTGSCDVRGQNAVSVYVLVHGGVTSFDVQIKGGMAPFGQFLALPDPSATQRGLIGGAVFDCLVGTPYVIAALQNPVGLTGSGVDVIAVPYVSPGSLQVQAVIQ